MKQKAVNWVRRINGEMTNHRKVMASKLPPSRSETPRQAGNNSNPFARKNPRHCSEPTMGYSTHDNPASPASARILETALLEFRRGGDPGPVYRPICARRS